MALTWFVRLMTLLVWAGAAGSATYWALKQVQSDNGLAVVASIAPPMAQASPADMQRALGRNVVAPVSAASAPPRPADPAARFALLGVVADRGNSGVALLSIDGKAARPYRVGTEVEDGLKLVKVAAREATLVGSKGGTSFKLELPRGGRPSGESRTVPSAAASAARPSG